MHSRWTNAEFLLGDAQWPRILGLHRQLYRGGTRGAEIKIVLEAQSRLSPMRHTHFLIGTLAEPSRRRISVTQTTSLAGVMHDCDKARRVTAASDKLSSYQSPGQFHTTNFWIGHSLPQSVGGLDFTTLVGLT